ncbi:hypothetical protein PMI42_06452, partial [Bradyrhizobium sp. YR681]
MRFQKLFQLAAVVVLSALWPGSAHAATGDAPAAVTQLDIAACLAAAA